MLAIIGGTGMAELLGVLGQGSAHDVDTPFGVTSAPIRVVTAGGKDLALLNRHGPGHLLNPTRVPYRANIFALKKLGVTHVLASGAVGSLREQIGPRELLIPDQIIDRTFRRPGTFFEELAVHVELAFPFCSTLRDVLLHATRPSGVTVHPRGTYVCIEGPQLSTRAESELHRSFGADVVGMTVMPEARLAREAELCYAMVALPTDYDAWRGGSLLQEVLANFKVATQNALELLRNAVSAASAADPGCACQSALKLAIWSDTAQLEPAVVARLRPLLGRYLPPPAT